MSIINVDSSFVNVSAGPYVIDNFYVNTKGFTASASGTQLVIPGLYDQGASILSCSLVCPTAGGATSVLNNGVVSVVATGNAQAGVVLYSALGTAVSNPSAGLGATLPQDSWLVLTYTGATPDPASNAVAGTGKAIGLCVKWTKLTETQNSFGL